MRQQHTIVGTRGRRALQALLDDVRVSGLAPGKLNARDLQAIALGDGREAIAEGPNGDRHHAIARGKKVGNGALLAACARSSVGQHGRGSLKEILQARGDAAHDGSELGSAMVDHRSRQLCQHLCGYRSRAGDAQVLLGNGSARLYLWYGNSFSFGDCIGCISQSLPVSFIGFSLGIISFSRKNAQRTTIVLPAASLDNSFTTV